MVSRQLKNCYVFSCIVGLIGVIVGVAFIASGNVKEDQWQSSVMTDQEQILNTTIRELSGCGGVVNMTCYRYDLDIGFIWANRSIITHNVSFECFDQLRDCVADLNGVRLGVVYFWVGDPGDYWEEVHRPGPYVKWIQGGAIALMVGILSCCLPCLCQIRNEDVSEMSLNDNLL